MRFPVFGHKSNPSIEPPVFRKSQSYCLDLVAKGEAVWIDEARHRKGVKLVDPELLDKDTDYGRRSEGSKHATITESECQRNAEFVAGARNFGSVMRAHQKIKAWPYVGDTKAVRVGIRVS